MDASQRLHQCWLVARGSHPIQFGLERSEALRVGGLLVAARAIKISDFLADRIALAFSRGLLQDVPFCDQVPLVKFDKADPLRLVRRNLRCLQPIATGILVEINAGIDSLINVVDAESRCRRTLSNTGDREKGEQKNGAETHEIPH